MIVGMGVDIVDMERFEVAMLRRGERLRLRLYTPEECVECDSRPAPMRSLAGRFAAKEAFSKAIGTGFHAPFRWHAISVGRDARGKPGLVPSEDMARHLAAMGVTASHISLTDDAGIAVAFVVLEG